MTRGWALFWGLVLVALGGFALLFNLGLLQPEQLSRVALLWPLLLVLVGAQIVAARLLPRNLAAIALSVVAFLLLAGSVGYVVSAPPQGQAHSSFTANDDSSAPATLKISLGAAGITVDAQPLSGQAARAAIDYSTGAGGRAPSLAWDAGTRTLEISHDAGAQLFGPSSPDRLKVTLNSGLPWTVELDTGASSATFDLGSVNLRRFTVNGGADTLNLTVGPPSGHVQVQVSGGANRVQLARPAGAAARVAINGGASSLQVDGHDVGSAIGTLTWSSPNYPGADAIDLSVDGGANRVTLTQSA